MGLTILRFFLLAGIAVVFYFSWVPSPRLALSGYVPNWLARWTDTDANMNVRTAVPMAMLGLLAGNWLILVRRSWLRWIITYLLLVLVIFVAELGQLVLPLRHFDWGDIGWGAIGSLSGLVIASMLKFVMKSLKSLVKLYKRSR